MIAFVRPDSWNFPLFLHVLGAMVATGALVLVVLVLVAAWRQGSLEQIRIAYRTLLLGAIPGWIVMRIGAQLIADKEFPDADKVPSWVDFGYIAAEPPLLLIIIATVITGRQVRKARRAEGGAEPTASRPATVLVSLVLAVYVVAIFVMTTKPD